MCLLGYVRSSLGGAPRSGCSKRGWGSWDDPRARAARGLRRMRRERPGALLARRAPTRKQWSLDARSKGQPRPLPLREVEKESEEPSPGRMARLGVPVGGRVRKLRAVGIIPSHPLLSHSSLRPCWTAFLSTLRMILKESVRLRASRFCRGQVVCQQAASRMPEKVHQIHRPWRDERERRDGRDEVGTKSVPVAPFSPVSRVSLFPPVSRGYPSTARPPPAPVS